MVRCIYDVAVKAFTAQSCAGERLISVAIMLLGSYVFAYVMGTVASILSEKLFAPMCQFLSLHSKS